MRSASARSDSASAASVMRRPMRASAAAYAPAAARVVRFRACVRRRRDPRGGAAFRAPDPRTRSNTRTNLRAGAGGDSTMFGAALRQAARSTEASASRGRRLFHRLRLLDLFRRRVDNRRRRWRWRDGRSRRVAASARRGPFRLRGFRGRTRRKNPGPVEVDAGVLVLERADRRLRRTPRAPTFTCGGVRNRSRRAGRSCRCGAGWSEEDRCSRSRGDPWRSAGTARATCAWRPSSARPSSRRASPPP